jgi:nucleotide-sensitive chloride channel 1A
MPLIMIYELNGDILCFVETHTVPTLFQALSQCSALHDSLLPNGEPSSFFGGMGDGFGTMPEGPDDDGEGWEDMENGDDADANGGEEGEGGGRVRSDFHSGGGPGARFRPY